MIRSHDQWYRQICLMSVLWKLVPMILSQVAARSKLTTTPPLYFLRIVSELYLKTLSDCG